MKYYTVNLYDVKYTDTYRGQTIYVSEVIVRKGFRTATELLTEQKIEILPQKALLKFGVVDPKYHNKEEFERTGYHLVVLEEELVPENLSTTEDIDHYVDDYDCSEYKEIYESIKEKNGLQGLESNLTVKQKAKKVSGTRK